MSSGFSSFQLSEASALTDLLEALLGELLPAHPAGLKEYALVRILRERGIPPFAASDLSDELALFRVHFLLFHALYRLQERLRHARTGLLRIHCLSIVLLPWNGESALEEPDPLRDYYLDASRLTATTREEVGVMLAWFWKRFVAFEGREAALAVLELPRDADPDAIKRRYRELAKQHHPDLGGLPARFREITEAYECLATF